MSYITIFALPKIESRKFAILDDICFGISSKDSTFKYNIKKYNNMGNEKLVLIIYSNDKNTAYKRGLLISKYYYEKTKSRVFFKVEGSD